MRTNALILYTSDPFFEDVVESAAPVTRSRNRNMAKPLFRWWSTYTQKRLVVCLVSLSVKNTQRFYYTFFLVRCAGFLSVVTGLWRRLGAAFSHIPHGCKFNIPHILLHYIVTFLYLSDYFYGDNDYSFPTKMTFDTSDKFFSIKLAPRQICRCNRVRKPK